MNLFEALENFAINLPGIIEDLRELKRDLRHSCEELAREGAELFTLGFQEMVLNKNSAWQTSEENYAAARRIVRKSCHRQPEIEPQYERVRMLFREHWTALEAGRLKCLDALQKLSLLLGNWEDDADTAPEKTFCLSTDICGKLSLLNLHISFASPDPTYREIVASVDDMAYRKILQDKGFDLQRLSHDKASVPGWLQRLWDYHRRSEEEFLAATACAEDSDATKATTIWECMQYEPLTDLAHRAIRLFHAGTEYCMARSNEIKQWLEGHSPASVQANTIRIRFRDTIEGAHILAELVVCPLVHEVEGAPDINPVFAKQVLSAEGLFD